MEIDYDSFIRKDIIQRVEKEEFDYVRIVVMDIEAYGLNTSNMPPTAVNYYMNKQQFKRLLIESLKDKILDSYFNKRPVPGVETDFTVWIEHSNSSFLLLARFGCVLEGE